MTNDSTKLHHVLVTREDPRPISAIVEMAGGLSIELPLLETVWLDFSLPQKHTLDDYNWVAFTSARAVEAIVTRAHEENWNWPPTAAAASIGNRTAHDLQAAGWRPKCVADSSGAQELVERLKLENVNGSEVLFPCSAIARGVFPEGLRDAGANVTVLPVYDTKAVWDIAPRLKGPLSSKLIEALRLNCIPTCASPSAVRSLATLAREANVFDQLEKIPIVVLGATTAQATVFEGLHPVEAEGQTLACLARKALEISAQQES